MRGNNFMNKPEKEEIIRALKDTIAHTKELGTWVKSWSGQPKCGLQKQWNTIQADAKYAESILRKLEAGADDSKGDVLEAIFSAHAKMMCHDTDKIMMGEKE